MHEVAPSAVSTADAIDMMIWVINLIVSFLVIITSFLFYTVPEPVEGLIVIGVILAAATAASGVTASGIASGITALVGP